MAAQSEQRTPAPAGYARRQRASDRSAGRRDGRRNIPSLDDALTRGQTGLQSAYQQHLTDEMFAAADNLRAMFDGIRSSEEPRFAQLDRAIADQEAAGAACEAKIVEAAAPLTEAELLPRNAEEEAWDFQSIRYRRGMMREYRMLRAKRDLTAAQKRLGDLREQRELAWQSFDGRLELVRVEVRRLRDLYSLRASVYWDGVETTHRNGRYLARLVSRPQLPLPPWAVGPVRPASSTPDSDAPDSDGSNSDRRSA